LKKCERRNKSQSDRKRAQNKKFEKRMKRNSESELNLNSAAAGGESRAAKRKRKNKEKKTNQVEQAQNQNQTEKKKSLSQIAKQYLMKKDKDNQHILSFKEDYDSNSEAIRIAQQILKVPLSDVPDSGIRARSLFEWIIAPFDVEKFYNDYWEKKPLLIERVNGKKYFSEWSSVDNLKKWIVEDGASIGKDFEIIGNGELGNSNINGKKLWDTIKQKNLSIRFYNIQVFDSKILSLFSALEEEFTSMIRGNIDLLFPNNGDQMCHSSNFDAFIMQIEGVQKVSVYAPESEDMLCERNSAQEVPLSELSNPLIQFDLHPGNFLYVPKGFLANFSVKQSNHSMSLRFGANERNTIADLLQLVVNEALEEVIQTNLAARKSLPRNYTSILGVVNADNVQNDSRDQFLNSWERLLEHLKSTATEFVDAGIDQIAKKYLSSRLPLNQSTSSKRFKVSLESKFSLVRKDIARLVLEEDKARLYHCIANSFESINESLETDSANLSYLEFEMDYAAPLEQILFSYPKEHAMMVKDIELDSVQGKIDLIYKLFQAGIIQIL
jgi:lysine-specific demethylase/histidyl-hydroxylase NO66